MADDQTFAFHNDASATEGVPQSSEAVTWSASEFIMHEKDSGWYMSLLGAAFLLCAFVYLITRDFVSVGFLAFGALMFGIYAGRKPRQMPYQVDGRGIKIGNRAWGYEEFRSFSVVQEGAFTSIVLAPLKRFSPLTTIYYPPEQEEKIVSIIANNLPMEERKQDFIDRFTHKIGF